MFNIFCDKDIQFSDIGFNLLCLLLFIKVSRMPSISETIFPTDLNTGYLCSSESVLMHK